MKQKNRCRSACVWLHPTRSPIACSTSGCADTWSCAREPRPLASGNEQPASVDWPSSRVHAHIERSCGGLSDTLIDSTIPGNYKLHYDLVSVCKLSTKQFKLIYRASRDGFEEKSFHTKCDNLPSTLTINKKTKRYVFGGYASVAWDIKSQ